MVSALGGRTSYAIVFSVLWCCQHVATSADTDPAAGRQMTMAWRHHMNNDIGMNLVLPRTVQISNHGGDCLDAGGTLIHLWNCDGSNSYQHWVQEISGLLRNIGAQKCLGVAGNGLELAPCNENGGSQLWEYDQRTGHLSSQGACMREKGSTARNAIEVGICDHIDATQEWMFHIPEMTTTPIGGGIDHHQVEHSVASDADSVVVHDANTQQTPSAVYTTVEVTTTKQLIEALPTVAATLASTETQQEDQSGAWIFNSEGGCLDAGGDSIHVWRCAEDSLNQKWQLDSATGHLSLKGGHCLDRGGSKLHLWTCSPDNDKQRWQYDSENKEIRALNTNDCLDWGGAVHLWACDPSNPNQKWRILERPSSSATPASTPTPTAEVLTGTTQPHVMHETTVVNVVVTAAEEHNTAAGEQHPGHSAVTHIETTGAPEHTLIQTTGSIAEAGTVEQNSAAAHATTNSGAAASENHANAEAHGDHSAAAASDQVSITTAAPASTAAHVKQAHLCLDAGGQVHMWTCDHNNTNQHWIFHENRLKNKKQCLTIDTQVRIMQCDSQNPAQFLAFDSETGQIKTKSGKCLAAEEANQSGSTLTTGPCSDDQVQHWDVAPKTDEMASGSFFNSRAAKSSASIVGVIAFLLVLLIMYATGVCSKCSSTESQAKETREMRAVNPEGQGGADEESSAALVESAPPQQSSGPPPMPEGWHETVDPATGRTYFWHDSNPEATVTWSSALDGELPQGWHQTWDAERGCSYYWNESDPDGSTTWIKPATSP